MYTKGAGESSNDPGFGENRVLEVDLTGGAPEAISTGLFQLPGPSLDTALTMMFGREE